MMSRKNYDPLGLYRMGPSAIATIDTSGFQEFLQPSVFVYAVRRLFMASDTKATTASHNPKNDNRCSRATGHVQSAVDTNRILNTTCGW